MLAADEKIDEPVIVVVAPGGRLRRDRLAQAAGDRDVFERAVPQVSQERHPHRLFPAAAQKEHVQVAIVVEVGVPQVESVDLIAQTGLVRAVLERAVSTVHIQRGAPVHIERGSE